MKKVNKICDVISLHPYWKPNDPNPDSKRKFEQFLDTNVAFAVDAGKPLLATECCWSGIDEKQRVESIRYTLMQLKQRNIGWLPYILHHSLVADAHRPEFGPLNSGNFSFIEADGALRPGHDV